MKALRRNILLNLQKPASYINCIDKLVRTFPV